MKRKFWRKTVTRALGSQRHWEEVKERGQEMEQGGDRRQLAAERQGDEDIKVWKLNLQDCTYLTHGPIPSEAWIPSEARDSVLAVDQFEATRSAVHRNTPVLSFCVMRLRNDWLTH